NMNIIFALLSYLNSTLTKLFSEILASPLGGGGLRWDMTPLRNLPVVDITSLSKSQIKKLSQSFDEFRKEVRKYYVHWKEKNAITKEEYKSKVEELRKNLLDKNIADILNLSDRDMNKIYETLEFLRHRRLKRLEKADYMVKGKTSTEELKPIRFSKRKRRKKDEKTLSLYRYMQK
ncbi:hypothetical protein DRN58_09470, partial [Thermococci archaeon]